MALRLNAAAAAKATAAPAIPIDRQLAERAGALLAAGDVPGYRALFAEAAAVEDRDRRYRARTRLLEHGLEAGRTVADRLLAPLFFTMAEAAADVLDENPREPVLVNYLGVSLYELNVLDAAERLFRAARRLDPVLPNVEQNLEQIARRRRRGVTLNPLIPPYVQVALPELARRAERIAAAARPADGLTISLCMIVKDEEEMLPRSLGAIHRAVDEIVIVDTGSTDRTVEIAESFGAKVIHRPWTGDFSEPRNVSFDAATSDWIIYLDADEVLVEEDADGLRELTGRTWREAFYLVETNFTGDLDDGTAVTHNALRVFRNRPEYRFEGRIHEQIAHTVPAWIPERLEATQVRVEHYGYLGAVRDAKEKSRRNTELLERQLAEGGDSPFLYFNLGSEHAAAGNARKSLENFQAAWDKLKDDPLLPSYGFVPSLVDRLTTALRVTGDRDGAIRQADAALEIFPNFTDLVLEQAYACRDAGDYDRAIGYLERCLEMGDAPSRYSATVGCGSYLALVALSEVEAARGNQAQAERLLERCLREYPGFLGVVFPLAVTALARGKRPEHVVAQVEEEIESLTPSVHFLLGTALYEAGHAEHSARQFELVLERQPANAQARVALAESLLSLTRWDEAAATAAEIDDDAPLAPAARRSELFARIVAGDAGAIDGALERARRSDMPATEVALFEAWAGAVAGAPLPVRLPDACAPLLVTTLEALLRVQEVDPFVALLPALERVGLPWRGRREQLAQMYFRRGFLTSAADEWITVCQEAGEDVDALIGLAQVAVAQQLPDDALLFAREAQALEPEHAGAANLIAALATAPA